VRNTASFEISVKKIVAGIHPNKKEKICLINTATLLSTSAWTFSTSCACFDEIHVAAKVVFLIFFLIKMNQRV
jgi:hypothetical protein